MANADGEPTPSKVDWSTPYDAWLLPILNRARHAGSIEFRAIPSEIQLEFDKVIDALLDRIKEKLQDKHRHSDSRSAELETSEDGYTYGLEDALAVIDNKAKEIRGEHE